MGVFRTFKRVDDRTWGGRQGKEDRGSYTPRRQVGEDHRRQLLCYKGTKFGLRGQYEGPGTHLYRTIPEVLFVSALLDSKKRRPSGTPDSPTGGGGSDIPQEVGVQV